MALIRLVTSIQLYGILTVLYSLVTLLHFKLLSDLPQMAISSSDNETVITLSPRTTILSISVINSMILLVECGIALYIFLSSTKHFGLF